MDSSDLRIAARNIFVAVDEPVARDISNKLIWAADTIDAMDKTLMQLMEKKLLKVLLENGPMTEEELEKACLENL